jgi:hypothetical protein
MLSYDGQAAPDGAQRTLHRHLWPGVDTALATGYPGVAAQERAIDCAFAGAIRLGLLPSSRTPPYDRFEVTLTNLTVGHAWPSGASQDRRAWVEFTAYDADGGVLLERGVVAEGKVVGADDDALEVLHDRLYDEMGTPVHMFWQAGLSDAHPRGYETDLLSAPTAGGPASRTFSYALPASATKVTARLRLQAIGLDVIDDFQGVALPITERVLRDGYVQSNTLRSRVRTITVPGSEHQLELRDGRWTAGPSARANPECADQSYVLLLGSEGP